jgi:glycosyltransferase involved in cell wall biosynthesis
MKIVHVIQDLKSGGLEHLFEDIVLGQLERGHQVRVVCLTSGGRTADRLQMKGVDLFIVGVDSLGVASLLKVRQSLLTPPPDVVHLHGLVGGRFGRLALVGTNVRTVYHVHTDLSLAHRLNGLQRWIERLLAKRCGRVVAVSKAVMEDLAVNIGIDRGKIEVLSGGISDQDPLHQGASKHRLNIPEGISVIVTLASLTEHKGIPTLLNAVSRIPGSMLLIAGEGPLKKDLEEISGQLSISDRVRFLGFVQDTTTLLAAADVVVLASWPREGLSLALIEAHRAGRPCVCTNVGGMPEVVEHGVTGFVVPPRDPGAMADALVKVLGDDALRERMGGAARKRFLEKYEKTGYLERLEWIYQHI